MIVIGNNVLDLTSSKRLNETTPLEHVQWRGDSTKLIILDGLVINSLHAKSSLENAIKKGRVVKNKVHVEFNNLKLIITIYDVRLKRDERLEHSQRFVRPP